MWNVHGLITLLNKVQPKNFSVLSIFVFFLFNAYKASLRAFFQQDVSSSSLDIVDENTKPVAT